MKIKKTLKSFSFYAKQTIPLVSLLGFSSASMGQEDAFLDFSLEELGQMRVTNIATGTDTPLDKAAAVVSVITDKDIEAIGAKDISEILETVPGLHVSVHPIDYTPKYNIRGITSAFGAQTLIMINSVPISSLYLGTPSIVGAGMPVKAIKKIEIIRGPGSALYGADAYAGVINITTKGGNDIPETQLGFSHGTYDTKSAWINYGERFQGVSFGLTAEYNETDGFKDVIESDGQTGFDALTGTDASLAPGKINSGRRFIDVRAELAADEWTIRWGYQGRDKIQPPIGIAETLSPEAEWSGDRANFDASYEYNDIEHLKITSRASYYYNDQQNEKDNLLFPAGSNAFYPLGLSPLYPDGIIGNPEYREEQARANIDAEYTRLEDHIFRFGLGYFWGDIYETKEQKNFTSTPAPLTPIGSVVEAADTDDVFLPERDRTNFSIYIQDEWFFSNNWALTTGLRYDDYSDFGDTLNPRLALVWATSDSITTKFLYGKAFRAPVFNELYVTSNPVNLGDPELDPEKIDTYELAVSHQVSDELFYSANTYYYEIDGIISLVDLGGPRQWQNTSDRKGYGFELEGKAQISSSLSLSANYSYQKSKDKDSNDDVGETPNNQVYARLAWQHNSMNIFTQVNRVGSQKRAPDDSRTKDLDHYTTVDLKIKRTNVLPNLDLSLSIKNLGDEDVFEPSLSPGNNLPNDHPMPGRTFYGEVEYTF